MASLNCEVEFLLDSYNTSTYLLCCCSTFQLVVKVKLNSLTKCPTGVVYY